MERFKLIKDGAKLQTDPTSQNIEACKDLSKLVRTSLGPNGLNKLVINHLGKLFCTHDAATIVRELEVEHPAAKLVVMASKTMDEEIGDGTNSVIVIASELLSQVQALIRTGLHPSDVISGYKRAVDFALRELDTVVAGSVSDIRDESQVLPIIRTAIYSKQSTYADFFAGLVTKACINSAPANAASFNVDNVRVCKLAGGSVLDSTMIHGFVIPRDVEGEIRHVKNAKIAVYATAVDNASTETKGNVVLNSAEELTGFSKSEEQAMERMISAIHKSGVNVIISSQPFGDTALHFLQRFGILALKIPSKHQIRRLCTAVGAQQILSLDPPTEEEAGRCDIVEVREVGGQKVVVFDQQTETTKISTIIVRGSTETLMDDVERALDDGINTYRALAKDQRYVAGAGAAEAELHKRILHKAEETEGMDQYAMRKFAQSMLVIPSTLAEVAGHNAVDCVTKVVAEHQKAGGAHAGVDVDAGGTINALEAGILDLYSTKYWALKLAADAAISVVSVHHIIMAKQAGGPKAPKGGGDDDD